MISLLQSLLPILVTCLGPLLALAITLYARQAMRHLAQIAGVTLTAAEAAELDRVIEASVLAAEEWGRRALSEHVPDAGPLKLAAAVSSARSLAPVALARVTDEQLELRIHAALGRARARPYASPGQ